MELVVSMKMYLDSEVIHLEKFHIYVINAFLSTLQHGCICYVCTKVRTDNVFHVHSYLLCHHRESTNNNGSWQGFKYGIQSYMMWNKKQKDCLGHGGGTMLIMQR